MSSPNAIQREFKDSVSTTDATQTTLSSIVLYPNETFLVQALVVGKRTGGSSGTAGDAVTYKIEQSFNNINGVTEALGSPNTLAAESTGQESCDASFTVSSPNILLQVTGASGNNFNWSSVVKITVVK